MLGIDSRTVRVTWTVLLFVLCLLLVYLAREPILVFIAALFLAYMLSPIVNLVSRITPRRVSRTAALAVGYVLLLSVIGLVGSWLGGQLVREANTLGERLPELIQKHGDLAAVPLPSWLEPERARVVDALRSQLHSLAERIGPMLQGAVGGVVGLAGGLLFVVIVPILTVLFLKDADEIRASLLKQVSPERRRLVDNVMQDIHLMLAQYIRALVVLSMAASITYLLFLTLIGLPYAVLASVLVAPLEFIPVLGPLAGALFVLSIAIFTGFPHIWWIIAFFAAYRAFQDYVLQPHLMSSGVEVHPLLVLFGVFAGEAIGGIWGMFLSVPVLAMLRIIYVRLTRKRTITIESAPSAEVSQ
jgi:predicted PurR-regulated permease PerM